MFKIVSMSGAHGQGTEGKFAEEFAEKLNEFISEGWKLYKCEFPNGPNGFRWVAMLKKECSK